MNKPHPHNDIIEKKLEQLPGANADSLWEDMHLILDKKMPQKKERRRFIAWFLTSKPFLLLTAGFVIGTGTTLFFLSGKNNSPGSITTLQDSRQPDKLDNDDPTKIFQAIKENVTAINNSTQTNHNNIPVSTSATRAFDHVLKKGFTAQQIKEQPEKYKTNEQFEEPVQIVIKSRPGPDMQLVHLKSNQDLHTAVTLNKEKNCLTLEPIPSYTNSNTRAKTEQGFYAGVISGIDLSSVNFRYAKAGSTKGFVVGYALNEKWSIESGLYWDTKRIFDDGAHFNPPGYTPTGGITIIAVNGKTRLYELPVNVKYTITSGQHRFFATTGLSSYLMRTENYDYQYLQNNQPGGHNYLSYKNETKNWFAVVNLSMGYTHKLGSSGTLRLEPYLKLPLKSIGVGKMPIMSTGLNVGFTKTVK